MTVEDDLRTALRQRAGQVGASDDAWRRIAERLGERAPHRRLILSIGSLAAAAAIVAAVIAVWPRQEPSRRVRVVGPSPTASLPSTVPAGPACRASQLVATPGLTGGGMSNDFTMIIFTNTSPTACVLSGYPALTGIAPGREVPLDPQHGTYFGDMVPVLLKPGADGQMLIATGTACSALNQPSQAVAQAQARANTFGSVHIELPDGAGGLTVDRVQVDVACGVSETQLGVRPPQQTTSAAPQCPSGQLRLVIQAQGENMGVVVAAIVVSPNAPCPISTQATLRLVDAAGIPLPGNPATAPLVGTAGTSPDSAQFPNAFYWWNWCGPSGITPHLQVSVPALGLTATATPPLVPTCVDARSGTTIAAIA